MMMYEETTEETIFFIFRIGKRLAMRSYEREFSDRK